MRILQVALLVVSLVFPLSGVALSAGAVVWSAPYQISGANPPCTGAECTFYFPKVGANQRLDIQFVSCRIIAQNLHVGDATLFIEGSALPKHFLNGTDHTVLTNTFFVISQPVVFSVPAGKLPRIVLQYVTSTTPEAVCTISGELRGLN